MQAGACPRMRAGCGRGIGARRPFGAAGTSKVAGLPGQAA